MRSLRTSSSPCPKSLALGRELQVGESDNDDDGAQDSDQASFRGLA